MKHFTTEECIDFVNQVISSSKKDELQKHLEQGCKRCSRTVLRWQRVGRIAKAEAELEPPPDAVRIAKASYAAANLGRKRGLAGTLAELLFDSFLQPAVEGSRSFGTESRQMLYRADPYQVDLQIEAKPDGRALVVTGQLRDYRHPDDACRNVPVMISNLRGPVIQTLTNQHGEFREEIKYSGDVELVFTGSNNKPVIISLVDALGKLSESTN
jgi:hypothetical protein